MTTPIIDDKSPYCIPFILKHLQTHQTTHPSTPLIIGLNGIQGAGKTTLATSLSQTLHSLKHPTLVFSIDDFYLPHTALENLATTHANNPLLQHRGEPGTHDVPFLASVFRDLITNSPTRIPKYDKSAFSGRGDRTDPECWIPVNQPGQPRIEIIIFEGWCVGFRALSNSTITALHSSQNTKRLHTHDLNNLLLINEKLKEYDVVTAYFHVFIHIDAEELEWVYEWREEQEVGLRREKGEKGGMSREEVVRFVHGYFPAYELFAGRLRAGVFKELGMDGEGRQLRLVVGKDRRVRSVVEI